MRRHGLAGASAQSLRQRACPHGRWRRPLPAVGRSQRWPSSSSQLGAGVGCGMGCAFREQQGPLSWLGACGRRREAWEPRPERVVGRGGAMLVVMGKPCEGDMDRARPAARRPCGHDGSWPQMDLWLGGLFGPSLGSAGCPRALNPEAWPLPTGPVRLHRMKCTITPGRHPATAAMEGKPAMGDFSPRAPLHRGAAFWLCPAEARRVTEPAPLWPSPGRC